MHARNGIISETFSDERLPVVLLSINGMLLFKLIWTQIILPVRYKLEEDGIKYQTIMNRDVEKETCSVKRFLNCNCNK